jgi:hypothetical protein
MAVSAGRLIRYACTMAQFPPVSASIWRVMATTVAAIIMAVSPAHAEESARDYFRPILTHQHFTVLSRALDLDQQQRMIAELVFSDYTDAVASMMQRADQAADEAGRQTVLEVYRGRRFLDAQQLRSLRVAVLETYMSFLPHLDEELDDLLEGVRSLLQAEQRDKLQPALQTLRRVLLLHPRQRERNSFSYAGDGVDVLELLTIAQRAEQELASLDAHLLQDVIKSYTDELDDLLVQTSAAQRENQMRMRLARIAQDAAAVREAEQHAMELWSSLYELNTATVRAIGRIAAQHLGQEVQSQWLDRYTKACFPWMFTEGRVDRQYAWLEGQGLTAAQQEQATRVYQAYQQRERELRMAAIELMLSARVQAQAVVYAMMDRSEITTTVARTIHTQLLHNSGELASAQAEAAAGFESLLSDEQRAAMRRAMQR